ncbi:MAG TPA: hypothetical protein VE988_23090 [Gemmataceae bacterium]|nr:hypothetical protein [Gemmataceae bacterium]
MSYRAKVVKVMIASPSDVAGECQAIRNVIQEWNFAHSEDKGIVLMPVGWESHSTPSLAGRPQALINKQVLGGCDLLIATFWTKLGTPTGKAASGTVEEIEEHIKAKKPAMIYFSLVPVVADSIDQEQYKALQQFKHELRQRGLYSEYQSGDDFRMKLTRQLAQTVNRHFTSKKNGNGQGHEEVGITQPRLPELSPPASELLVETTQDRRGLLYKARTMRGLTIQTNGKDFVEGIFPRKHIRWEGALKELRNAGLLEDRGNKGEVYAVTHEGYRVADLLRERQYA